MCMLGLVGLVVVVGLDAVYVYVYDSFAIWSKGPSTLYTERFAYESICQRLAKSWREMFGGCLLKSLHVF